MLVGHCPVVGLCLAGLPQSGLGMGGSRSGGTGTGEGARPSSGLPPGVAAKLLQVAREVLARKAAGQGSAGALHRPSARPQGSQQQAAVAAMRVSTPREAVVLEHTLVTAAPACSYNNYMSQYAGSSRTAADLDAYGTNSVCYNFEPHTIAGLCSAVQYFVFCGGATDMQPSLSTQGILALPHFRPKRHTLTVLLLSAG
jgi:hypothetical protein